MNLQTLIRLCKEWNALGWSVQEQCEDFLQDGPDGLNSNALKLIERWLYSVKRAADHALDDANEALDALSEEVADLLDLIAS